MLLWPVFLFTTLFLVHTLPDLCGWIKKCFCFSFVACCLFCLWFCMIRYIEPVDWERTKSHLRHLKWNKMTTANNKKMILIFNIVFFLYLNNFFFALFFGRSTNVNWYRYSFEKHTKKKQTLSLWYHWWYGPRACTLSHSFSFFYLNVDYELYSL